MSQITEVLEETSAVEPATKETRLEAPVYDEPPLDASDFENAPLDEPIHKQLRRWRKESGIRLYEIHKQTSIKMEYLMAIERGEVEALPPGHYQRSFIRSYLGAIGIEDHNQVEEILHQMVGTSWQPAFKNLTFVEGARQGRSRQSAGNTVFGVGVVAFLGLLVYFFGGQQNPAQIQTTEAASLRQTQPAPVAPASAAARAQAPGTSSAPVPPAAPPGVPGLPDLTAAAAQPLGAFTGVKAGTQQVAEPPPSKASAHLQANADVWIRISPESGPSRELTLKKGDTLDLDLTEPTWLRVGNAGGLELTVNGQRVDLGDSGQVRKVLLDPADLSKLSE